MIRFVVSLLSLLSVTSLLLLNTVSTTEAFHSSSSLNQKDITTIFSWTSSETALTAVQHRSRGDETTSSPSFNRRAFFQKAVVSSLSVAGATAFTLGSPRTASAATTSTVVDKVYTPEQHSLDNKVIVITGGTTGLGLESAKRLAYGGATVVVTSRTSAKGEATVASIKDYLSSKDVVNSNIYSVQLDLDDLDNVREFPTRLQSSIGKDTKINVLMNNAGVMAVPNREITKDGYEKTFQSNHLGHFLLTNKLMPMIADNSIVINVSSEAHKFAGANGLELDNLNGERQYGPWSSYGQSKLANILFSKELQQRANAANKSITAVSLHPGAVQTDLSRYVIGTEKWEQMKKTGQMSLADKILLGALSKFVLTVDEGATTQVYLAATSVRDNNDIVVGGNYYDKCKPVQLDPFASDMSKAKALWEISEKLTGEKFTI